MRYYENFDEYKMISDVIGTYISGALTILHFTNTSKYSGQSEFELVINILLRNKNFEISQSASFSKKMLDGNTLCDHLI